MVFLFTHMDADQEYLVFYNEVSLFLILKSAVSKFIVGTLVKGLPFKVSLPPPSSDQVCTLTLPNLGSFEHFTVVKVEVPSREDLVKSPAILCRVTPSLNTSDLANFKFCGIPIPLNLQIPYKALPPALIKLQAGFVKVAFTSRTIRANSAAARRLPAIEDGSFFFCDSNGEDLPAPLAKHTITTQSVSAVRDGFHPQLVVGVPEGKYDFPTASAAKLRTIKLNRATSFRHVLEQVGASIEDEVQKKYFNHHFGYVFKPKSWTDSTVSPTQPNLAPSGPTVIFFLGFSDHLTVATAEALGLEAARNFGILVRIITPAAIGSNERNFSELNTPRAPPLLSRNLFNLSSPLQLGVLEGETYRLDHEMLTPYMAYDICTERPPLVGHTSLPVQMIDIVGIDVPDSGYLTDPSKLYQLFVSASESGSSACNLMERITSVGRHIMDIDFTERSGKFVVFKSLLHSAHTRERLSGVLSSCNGVSTMLPSLLAPSVKASPSLVTVRTSPNSQAIPPNVLLRLLTDKRIGVLPDKLLVHSNNTFRCALPEGLNQMEFSLLLQSLNKHHGSEMFLCTLGVLGTLSLRDLRPPPVIDPNLPSSFLVSGPFTTADNDLLLDYAKKLGATNPRRVLRQDKRSDLAMDWMKLPDASRVASLLGLGATISRYFPQPGDCPFPIRPTSDFEDFFKIPTAQPFGSQPLKLPDALETALAALLGEKGIAESMNVEPPTNTPAFTPVAPRPPQGLEGSPVLAPGLNVSTNATDVKDASQHTNSPVEKDQTDPAPRAVASSEKAAEKDGDSSQVTMKLTDQSKQASKQLPTKEPPPNASTSKGKQSTIKPTKNQKKGPGTGTDTEFDLYPAEPLEQTPWEVGPAVALANKRLRSPTDLLNQSPTKHQTGTGKKAPASPTMTVSELELRWAAWTKEGLLSVCKSHGITLLATNKLAIIKAVISQRITFSSPPKEFQAQEIRTTSPVAGSTK